ncbi:DASH family cryptochrome [Pedobacter yulinensis]|uniref:Cryptochrome DASH n=1 Tax=Pedobacter yulinensis TaxID=2126353 RepID=A0A2T3HPJ2_9SPHI|nr:DASH family cryptochrome [Pedobacter yulinensis]PST84368.1 DASH family cryptochrome [Pedobacter yulinensis]
MNGKKILVWFRNDLRLHDNEILLEALAKSDEILPVYVFDPRHYSQVNGFWKTGQIRAQFIIESVAALRRSLQALGGNLLVQSGRPEELIPALVSQYEINEVYHHREVAAEETRISARVEDALWKLKVNLRHFIGHTLYNKEDLPFPIKDIPEVFSQFKKKTERDAVIKPCFEAPLRVAVVEAEDWGLMPDLQALGYSGLIRDERAAFNFTGGEAAGLAHLEEFIAASAAVKGKNKVFPARMSAWLALGCVSPRKIYWAMRQAEEKFGAKSHFSQVIIGLLWRDYFRFMFKKHGNTYFKKTGFKDEAPPEARNQQGLFKKWTAAETGHNVIDAIMRELNYTGFISHSARQLVAVYLVYEMKVDWTLGASYFEEKLIDYCPASNWGNWAGMSGVGSDQKNKGSFDLEKEVKNIDPEGLYASTWS